MSYTEFLENPWKNSHPSFTRSAFFQHRPSPEYATGEVLLSSLYRACGFEAWSEKGVPAAGRDFVKRTQMPMAHQNFGTKLTIPEWQTVIGAILESPKQANQSSKRFVQMCPVVPDVALYSGAARLAGNPWNPGQLVEHMIMLGSGDPSSAQALWSQLASALEVNAHEDVWARWLHQEFGLRRENRPDWESTKLQVTLDLLADDKGALNFPAKQFCYDLGALLKTKHLITRRQWGSLLESLLRLGAVTHILWLSDVSSKLWHQVKLILQGKAALSTHEVRDTVVTCTGNILGYGDPALQVIRDYTSRYLVARLGLNAVLWSLSANKHSEYPLDSCANTAAFLAHVEQHRQHLIDTHVMRDVMRLQDEYAKIIACKKGIGSNLVEFCRYVLGQRQTADENLRGYDQGYYLRKKGDYDSAPFVVSMGPVAILAMVHCCLSEAAGPRSIQALCYHLARYGILISQDDVTAGDLGRKLRTLGLVLDSPDAESGMLLVPPFR